MASILAQQFQQHQQQNSNPLMKLMQLRQQGSSNFIFNQMYNSNPQFRQFADSMQGKTPEQAFHENGLDFSSFQQYKW